MLNKKLSVMLAALCAGSVMAAVDSAASYFTVDNHNVPVGTPVTLTIRLFDASGEPVEAKQIAVRAPSGVTVVTPPEAAGQPGVYTAVVKADKALDADITVRADGTVDENDVEYWNRAIVNKETVTKGILFDKNGDNRYTLTDYVLLMDELGEKK